MKIEIDIVRNGDGNPCVVISSPVSEQVVIRDISEKTFEEIIERDPLENVETLATVLEPEMNPDMDTRENLLIQASRKDGCHTMALMAGDPFLDEGEVLLTGISKKCYKKFLRADITEKLRIACKEFEKMMANNIE